LHRAIMSKGTKRASPGATEEKENPLQGIELSDEDAQKLNDIQKATQRIEIWVERETAKRQVPLWEKRRETLKSIPKFWPVALMNHVGFGVHVQHNADQLALTYLEDVWLTRDPQEFRAFTLEFVSARLRCAVAKQFDVSSCSFSRKIPTSPTRC
jgi:template-activating factor I